jgi:predicted membrane channel-forming protein YqfA (hemolysin III family)
MPNLKSTSSIFASIYRVAEIGLIALIAYLSLFIRFDDGIPPNTNYWVLIFGVCALYGLLSSALYQSWRGTNTLESILALSKIWGLVLLIAFVAIVFTQTGASFSRQWLAVWSIGTWFTLFSFRLIFAFVFL